MNITIKGTLAQAPENRTTLSNEASVIFTVLGVGGWPVEARVKLGQNFREAEDLAAFCKRGDEVEVEATGLSPRTDHSVAAILLRGVTRVELRGAYGCFVVPGLLR